MISWLTSYLSYCSLEVILKDASNPFGPIEGSKKELPYSFDVRSSIPRTKQITSGHTHQANIGPSCSAFRGKHPGPAATVHSEDSTFGIDALCISPAPGASAPHIIDGNRGRGECQVCTMTMVVG